MSKNSKNYPAGDGIGSASVRGESIIAYYQQQCPGATTADLIADILAAVECDRQVSEGEARAEGRYTSSIDTPDSVIEEAESALETMIFEFKAEYERGN